MSQAACGDPAHNVTNLIIVVSTIAAIIAMAMAPGGVCEKMPDCYHNDSS